MKAILLIGSSKSKPVLTIFRKANCSFSNLIKRFQNQNDENESHYVLMNFINKTIRQIHLKTNQ